MEVELAKTAGFCYGVERAVAMVLELVEGKKEEPIYTFGPIIHNDLVLEELKQKGVSILNSVEEANTLQQGTVLIRAHGVSKEILSNLSRTDAQNNPRLKIKDATCPFVSKIHHIVEKEGKNGSTVIIIGDREHPEVQGILGWCTGQVFVVKDEAEVEKLSPLKDTKLAIVAQTTYHHKKFQQLVEIIEKKGYNIVVYDTICNATEERQAEAYQMAKKHSAMIVIGGKHSSNTRKLFDICKTECANTYFIEQPDDMDFVSLQSFHSVGITAGASTPNNIIKEVFSKCRKQVLNNY